VPSWTAITTNPRTAGGGGGGPVFAWQATFENWCCEAAYGLFFSSGEKRSEPSRWDAVLRKIFRMFPVVSLPRHFPLRKPSRRLYSVNTPIKSASSPIRRFAFLHRRQFLMSAQSVRGGIPRLARPECCINSISTSSSSLTSVDSARNVLYSGANRPRPFLLFSSTRIRYRFSKALNGEYEASGPAFPLYQWGR